MKEYDYLVVGAGLFAAVFVRQAIEAGKRCLVIDKRSHICPACAHPLLHCMAAVIYNKEYCKHHPVFSRKDTLSCEFVFIPLAARST